MKKVQTMTEIEKWPFDSSSSHWRRVIFRPRLDITAYELAVCVKLLTLNAEEMYFPRLDSDPMKDHFGKEWEDIVLIDRHFIDLSE